jgi:ankyrin repeat protein
VLFGRVDIIPDLITHGADAAHRDAKGQTAFDVAKGQGNSAVVSALQATAGRAKPH